MKISARNQFSGVVTALEKGAVNDEVELTLKTGIKMVAVVTRESSDSLGLREGAKVFALIKASSVILASDLGGVRLSARNQFRGTVRSVTAGAVNAEVELGIEGGDSIVAIVTNASVESLGLAPGAEAIAIVKASSVILGTVA
ncbi:TOBE domain-containing protein [Pusillimonas sp.]|uniref:TOBE domain-containing protein n=1 Tax=Pusillimonas sp. TaxID=3040095 RepID=UPI0029BEADC6|nr:TOBE domain-containing protein [Pusillimonas sp.]MDX3895976.1 TOBE domain-containing protein [Pusillimonas sp.]